MKKIRLMLAKWLWPKEVSQGELFTIVRWLRDGKPCHDGSWVGQTLKAEKVDGDRMKFSVLNEYRGGYEKVESVWLMPGHNCEVKPIACPLLPEQRHALYTAAKQAA